MTIKRKGKLYLGTSGWLYPHWQGIFYPDKLKSGKEKLVFYAKHFSTVEVNYSFYHLPQEKTYLKWKTLVPKNFLFTLKVSRYITHIKRLKEIDEAWQEFLKRAKTLKENLGPFLFQFPPSFSLKNLDNLKKLLTLLKKEKNLRFAFEFRHSSWQNKEVFSLLKKAKVALVSSHSSRWPRIENFDLANFVYFRFHGPKELFASNYPDKFLEEESQKIKKILNKGKDVFVYFNNDFYGYAIKNALFLKKLLERD